ncbi:DUF3732 domain-containing protein [Paraburkholderia strydomiana]|uniref:DUF3732 domain-containing protein n=1 Tax=Paraburkholderia strydomiana TaxID=1245417 RepID=A0ABW9BXI2_9BURK
MQFFIKQLLLWPENPEKSIRALTFEDGKVNVIHGRSGTGKSSVLAIIDYCLGSSRCSIPVGVIRDLTAWFGLRVRIRGTWLLIARRTPERLVSNKEFHISTLGAADDLIPETLPGTHTLTQFKDTLNEIARVTNVSLVNDDEDGENAENRPSYRDLASFNLLPQHIVANPNVLFYKSDSYKHKEKLKRVLPYALGIVDVEYLTKTRERKRLQKSLDGLQAEEMARHRAFASWEADVREIWNQSVQLGLTNIEDGFDMNARVDALKELNDNYLEGRFVERLQKPQYGYSNHQFRLATEEEEKAQREVDDLGRELRDYERLSDRSKQLATAVNTEKHRVVNLGWLRKNLVTDSACVVCGSQTNHSHDVLGKLEERLSEVTRLSEALLDGPIVDRQLEQLRQDLSKAEEKLQAARLKRAQLEPSEVAPLDSLGRAFILLGRPQSLLMALATLEGRGSFADKIRDLEGRIQLLDTYILNCGHGEREKDVGKVLSDLIAGYASLFNVEVKGTVALDISELTLTFARRYGERKDYLWEIGSGANWMAFHLATFLALHEYFTDDERVNGPVFSYLAIDQPSQVYFPSTYSGDNILDGFKDQAQGLSGNRDNDVRQTRLIFIALARGLQRSKLRYQTIVVEHADKTIWGNGKWGRHIHEVADWKDEGKGLIPAEWFD